MLKSGVTPGGGGHTPTGAGGVEPDMIICLEFSRFSPLSERALFFHGLFGSLCKTRRIE